MKYLIKNKNGSVAVMYLADDADANDAFKKYADSHPTEKFIDFFEFNGELPVNREFRDAWVHCGPNVIVDENKAMPIHLNRVRHARNAALVKLDSEQLRYLPDPDKLREIESKKQELRDLPANVNGLEWPSQLER